MSGTVHVMNRLCLFVCGYYWIKVTGGDNLSEARRARALMVINHSAYFDMPVLFHVVTCSAVAMSAVQNVRHPPALSRALATGTPLRPVPGSTRRTRVTHWGACVTAMHLLLLVRCLPGLTAAVWPSLGRVRCRPAVIVSGGARVRLMKYRTVPGSQVGRQHVHRPDSLSEGSSPKGRAHRPYSRFLNRRLTWALSTSCRRCR